MSLTTDKDHCKLRCYRRAAKFEVFDGEDITAMQKDGDLNIVLGSAEGQVKMFDLRYPAPIFTKSHPYMVPINEIIFHEKAGKMIVSDEKSIRLYEKDTGNLFTTVESKFKINGVKSCQNSGLLLVPQESSRVGTFFIPALGPAPKWCSFVENMTEELEEKQTETIYNDYKFLNQEEVEKLNANHLLGTKFLQSYMHGFIMKSKLYNKLKEQCQTFDYQAYKEDQIHKRLEKEVAKDKIFNKQLKAKVNAKMIERNERNPRKDTLNGKATETVLKDSRFGGLTQDPDFERDEENEDFKLRNPSLASKAKQIPKRASK
jgi:ribosome biogenesis protein ENP2